MGAGSVAPRQVTSVLPSLPHKPQVAVQVSNLHVGGKGGDQRFDVRLSCKEEPATHR